jgi:flagellar hook-associated protein 2
MAIAGANLDVNGIVSQLMSIEQRPIVELNKKEADYQAKISAYGNISSALSGFQTAVQDLNHLDKFQTLKATASDATVFTASATSKAVAGSHSVNVSSLAQAQKLVADGQVDDTSSIGTGATTKLTFDFGSINGGTLDEDTGTYKEASFTSNGQGIKTVTIDANNNSLQGIRDAINSAKIGVTATVINDGSKTPYSLTLSSSNSGANNSMKISVAGDAALSALLSQDPAGEQKLSQTVAAQNAVFAIDGVTVKKTSNSISDVIPGVTLELQKTSTAPVTLNVTRDSGTVTTLVQGFVKAFNDLNKTLQDLTAYNSTTKQGAVLQGDSTVRLLQSQIRSILNTPVTDTGGAYSTLSQIGISLQKDGTMAVDTSKLNAAIDKNPNDVASLFVTLGRPTDPTLSFVNAADSTPSGTFPVHVSQLATHGSFGGCEDIDSLTIKSGKNDQLNVSVDGVSAAITLAPGEYTEDKLAKELQSKINGAATLAKAGVSVSVVHDQFGYMITSNSFGSKSSVDVTGNGAWNIFGEDPVCTQGGDVEGAINNTMAKGTGQTLVATDGAALGIKVAVNGGTTGERGQVHYSQGYAQTLNNLITSLLAKEGQLEGRKSGITKSIKDVASHRDTVQQRLPLQEARYRKQYSSLETMLSNMSKTSSYLTQQLSNLPRPY